MNSMTRQFAAIALLTIASAPAYSMSWNHEEVIDSVIAPSPLMQIAHDSAWGSEIDGDSDVYMPIANDRIAHLDDSDNGTWNQ